MMALLATEDEGDTAMTTDTRQTVGRWLLATAREARDVAILLVVVVLLTIAAGMGISLFGNNWRTLHDVAWQGRVEAIGALVDAGADVEARNEDGRTPLHLAARQGHSEVIRALADVGADVDAAAGKGARPLHLAAWQGHPEAVRALLDAGADAGAQTADGRLPADVAAEAVKTHPVFRELDAARGN